MELDKERYYRLIQEKKEKKHDEKYP